MTWPRLRSLQTRLFLLVVLALTPAILLHLASTLEKRHMARIAAEANLRAMTDLASGSARIFIEAASDLLRGIASLPQLVSPEPEQTEALLATAKKLYPQFSELALLAPGGRIVASSRPGRSGEDLSARAWFHRAMKGASLPVSGLAMNDTDQPAGLILAQPVKNPEGKTTGVCALSLGLGWFERLFTEIHLPEKAQACLLDGRGRILATWPRHPGRIGRRVADAGTMPTKMDSTGQSTWTAPAKGETFYNVIAAVPAPGDLHLRLRLRLPLQAVLAPLDTAMRRDIALLVLSLALALVSAHWFSRRFVLRPAARLAEVAKDLASGKPNRCPELARGTDEMAELARALFAMADAFQERIRFTQEIIDVVPAPLYYKDASGHYLGCNRAYSTDIRPLSVMFGKLAAEFAPPSQADLCAGMDRTVLANPQQTHVYECPVTFLDGSVHDMVISKSVFRNAAGETAGIVAVMLDITERKRSERALAASENKYRALLASMSDGFVAIDASGRMVESNPAFRELIGYTQEELAGMTLRDIMPSPWTEDEQDILERSLDQPEASDLLYREYRRKNGSTFPAALRVSRYPDQPGNPCRFFAIARDMTMLAAYETDLRAAKEAAETASRAKSDFLAKMSHEIRTPLNAVTGMIELTLATALTPEQRDALDTAREASSVLLGVINDILDISRIEARKLELSLADFDLRRTMATMVRALRPQAVKRGLALSLRLAPDLPRFVRGDQGRFRQILLNLIGNALKFTEHGEVALSAGSVPGTDPETVTVEIGVADTGIGIPPDKLDHIFELFSQVDASRVGTAGGTGLGLAICRELARLMHGGIRVRSTPGQGSAFTVTLAFAPGRAPTVPHQPEKAPSPTRAADKPLRILLAEDNPINVKVAMTYLTRRGHRAVAAENGRRALALLATSPFDVVLMDVEMPDINGIEATVRLRAGLAGEQNRHIPVIAMTAHALGDANARCLEAGMTAYLSKPIDFKALDDLLAKTGAAAPPIAAPAAPARAEADLNTEAALARLDGDAALLREVQTDFLRLYPDRLRTITLCQQTENWEEAAMAAHSLRNIVIAVGAETAGGLARQLEESLRRGDAFAAEDLLTGLTDNLGRVGRKVREIVTDPTHPISP